MPATWRELEEWKYLQSYNHDWKLHSDMQRAFFVNLLILLALMSILLWKENVLGRGVEAGILEVQKWGTRRDRLKDTGMASPFECAIRIPLPIKVVSWTRRWINGVRKIMMLFWVWAPCRFVGRYQRFGGIYCPHLQHQRKDLRMNTATKPKTSSSPLWKLKFHPVTKT
jgi:hypothetical protein